MKSQSFIDHDRKESEKESQTPGWAIDTALFLVFALIAILCSWGLVRWMETL